MGRHPQRPLSKSRERIGSAFMAIAMFATILAAHGCTTLLSRMQSTGNDEVGQVGPQAAEAYRSAIEAYRGAAENYARTIDVLLTAGDREQPQDPALLSLAESVRQLVAVLSKQAPPPAPVELKLDRTTSEQLAQTLSSLQQLADELRKATTNPVPVVLDHKTSDQLTAVISGITQISEQLKGIATAPFGGTVKLDAGSIEALTEALAKVATKPDQETDLWKNSAFQTLMSTLWQAPLAILAILLALGSFVGYQGYQNITKRVAEQAASSATTYTSMSTAAGFTDTALRTWQLGLDLETKLRPVLPANGIKEPEKVIEREIPVQLTKPEATAHINAAKELARLAVRYIQALPRKERECKLWKNRSGEFVRLEAQAAFAYYAATAWRESQQDDWAHALEFSDEALNAVTDPKSVLWLKEELGDAYLERAAAWVDTYIYVRFTFVATTADWPLGEREFFKALKVYENATFRDVRDRFAPVLLRHGFPI